MVTSFAAPLKKFKFWHEVLPHVTKRQKQRVREAYGGQTIGVDAESMIWENANTMDEVLQAIGNRLSYYEPTKMMRAFERMHELYLLQNVTPIYVFGGEFNPVARWFKGRDLAYNRMYAFYTVHGIAAMENPNKPRLREYTTAATQIRKMRDVDPKLIRFLANWMQSLGMEVIGAPFEPHWQLVELERQGRTTGTVCSHMNVVIAGGKNVLFNPNTRENMRCSVFKRDRDLCKHNWTYDFTKYIDYLPEFAAMYGTIYNFRVSGLTVKHLYRKAFPKLIEAMRNREDYWAQLANADEKFTTEYRHACNQFRYGPVWRSQSDDSYTIEPLNPLPEGSSWEDLLGYDPIKVLTVDPVDYKRAANFQGCTFVDEASMSPWYKGIFPKMREVPPEGQDDDDDHDEDGKPLDYLAMLRRERLRVPRPGPKLKEPVITDW